MIMVHARDLSEDISHQRRAGVTASGTRYWTTLRLTKRLLVLGGISAQLRKLVSHPGCPNIAINIGTRRHLPGTHRYWYRSSRSGPYDAVIIDESENSSCTCTAVHGYHGHGWYPGTSLERYYSCSIKAVLSKREQVRIRILSALSWCWNRACIHDCAGTPHQAPGSVRM
jgi:hypothetical protein